MTIRTSTRKRTGDTTYGFHNTSGRDAFDFYKNWNPVVAIWDAGGVDTVIYTPLSRLSSLTPRYTLVDNAENMTMLGAIAADAAGNGLDNFLVGNDAANTLSGFEGHDTIEGGLGDDVPMGGGGEDWLLGGMGWDAAAFEGRRADYVLTENADGWTGWTKIVNTAAGEAEWMTSVETLQFADETIAALGARLSL